MPSDMLTAKSGSAVLTGSANNRLKVSPSEAWGPKRRTTGLVEIWLGSFQMTARTSPSMRDEGLSLTVRVTIRAGAALSVGATMAVTFAMWLVEEMALAADAFHVTGVA